MIHNVDSHTMNVSGQEHHLKNCVHKHEGGMLDAEMDMKSSKQAVSAPPATQSMSPLEYLMSNMKKILGNGLGLLRGIWRESEDEGNNREISGVLEGEEQNNGQQNSHTDTVVNTMAMETVADIRVPQNAEHVMESESGKVAGAISGTKVKTGLARERFEAGKDAFLKRLKEMTKSRKRHSFEESKEERPGQQERDMEWFQMGNSHLLDSYDKNGEYANLGNRVEGRGYSGSPVKENYSKKV